MQVTFERMAAVIQTFLDNEATGPEHAITQAEYDWLGINGVTDEFQAANPLIQWWKRIHPNGDVSYFIDRFSYRTGSIEGNAQ